MTDYEFIQIISDSRRTSEHERAFKDFYNKYEGIFCGYIRSIYRGNDDVISTLYNDSCMALSNQIHNDKFDTGKYAESVNLKYYLFTIGRNKLIDLFRKNRHNIRFIDEIDYDGAADEGNVSFGNNPFSTEAGDEKEERFAIIRHAVSKMKEPCNKILTMFYWDEMSGKEIADICGYAGEDSVKTQKYKCMNKLKTYIKNILR